MKITMTVKDSAIKKMLTRLRETKDIFTDMSKKTGELIAKAFVARARKRLIAFTNDRRYSYYIRAVKDGESNWSVIVGRPKYDPDIMYFFEYGTGFVGRDSEQNPAKPVGWEYAINEGESWYGVMDLEFGRQKGWYFNYKPNHFVQEEDGGYTNRKTGQRVIFTSGIKPVMYIYKTRVEIQNLLKEVKGKKLKISYKQLKSRLNKLISGDIM